MNYPSDQAPWVAKGITEGIRKLQKPEKKVVHYKKNVQVCVFFLVLRRFHCHFRLIYHHVSDEQSHRANGCEGGCLHASKLHRAGNIFRDLTLPSTRSLTFLRNKHFLLPRWRSIGERRSLCCLPCTHQGAMTAILTPVCTIQYNTRLPSPPLSFPSRRVTLVRG